MSDSILKSVAEYYSSRIAENGATPCGVDWKDERAQKVRFDKLLSVIEPREERHRLVELGCGYGALWEHASIQGLDLDYEGLDISQEMIAAARKRFGERPGLRFTLGKAPTTLGDYCVASGVFNVKLDIPREDWERYVLSVIADLDRYSLRGFGFNCLTSYSDEDKRSPRLYYGDPCFYFDLCKRCYGFNVTLLHDYDMYDFTILVRKRTPGA